MTTSLTVATLGQPGEEVIPWLDQPPADPFPDNGGNLLKWEELDSWLIPCRKLPLCQPLRPTQLALMRHVARRHLRAWSPVPSP